MSETDDRPLFPLGFYRRRCHDLTEALLAIERSAEPQAYAKAGAEATLARIKTKIHGLSLASYYEGHAR